MDERATERRPAEAEATAAIVERVVDNLARVLHVPRDILELAVICLVAEGHLIIEDFPGVGKTVLAKALARSIDCSFSRLQFTPDLLPSDVTGVSVFDQRSNEFEFRPGPAVHGHGDAEPDRVRGHLRPARGAARPVLHAPLARLPAGGGGSPHALR